MKLKSKILLGAFGVVALAVVPTTIALTTTSCGSSSAEEVSSNPNIIYKPDSSIKSKFRLNDVERIYNNYKLMMKDEGHSSPVNKSELKVSLIGFEFKILIDSIRQEESDPMAQEPSQPNIIKETTSDTFTLTPNDRGYYDRVMRSESSGVESYVEPAELTSFLLKEVLYGLYTLDQTLNPDYQGPTFPEVQYNPDPSIGNRFDYETLCHLYNAFLVKGLNDSLAQKLTKPKSSGTIKLEGTQLTCNITFSGVNSSNKKETFTNEYRYELTPNASGEYVYGLTQSYGPNANKEIVSNLTLQQLRDNLSNILRTLPSNIQ